MSKICILASKENEIFTHSPPHPFFIGILGRTRCRSIARPYPPYISLLHTYKYHRSGTISHLRDPGGREGCATGPVGLEPTIPHSPSLPGVKTKRARPSTSNTEFIVKKHLFIFYLDMQLIGRYFKGRKSGIRGAHGVTLNQRKKIDVTWSRFFKVTK